MSERQGNLKTTQVLKVKRDLTQLSIALCTLGILLLTGAFFWWLIYYARAAKATKVFEGNLEGLLDCFSFKTSLCESLSTGTELPSFGVFMAGGGESWLAYAQRLSRPDGIIAYQPALFWFAFALLLAGFLLVSFRSEVTWARFDSSHVFVASLLILPSLVGFVIFFLLPSLNALQISFHDWNFLREPKFVGLENFQDLFADKRFRRSLRVTSYYMLLSVPAQMVFGLAVAVFLDRIKTRFGAFIANIMILPWLIPPVAAGVLFVFMYLPEIGIVNHLISWLGFEKQSFFGSPNQVIPALASISVWQYTGYSALLFLVGLKSIPKELYHAAAIDGSSAWRTFWHITLPLLKPMTGFVFAVSFIAAFQVFDTIAVAQGTGPTGGGPAGASRVLIFYIYDKIFNRAFDMGTASSASVVLLTLLLLVTIIQLLWSRSSDLRDMTEQTYPTTVPLTQGTIIWKRWLRATLIFIALCLLCFFILFPIYWAVRTAISDPASVYARSTSLLPFKPTLISFAAILGLGNPEAAAYPLFLRNSIIVASVSTVASVFFSAMAAFAFARLRFPLKNILFTLYLTGLMVPAIVLLVPNYVLINQLGWIGTFQGIIAPSFFMTPFAVYFLRQAFLNLNKSVEEAAILDGSSLFGLYWRIALPLAQGTVLTLALITFITNWNQYLWPLFVGKNESVRMLTVELATLSFNWSFMSAAVLLSMLPAVILFTLFGRKLIDAVEFSRFR